MSEAYTKNNLQCSAVTKSPNPAAARAQVGRILGGTIGLLATTQFFTRTANDACVQNLVRAAQRHLRLSPLTMNRHVRTACGLPIDLSDSLGEPIGLLLARRANARVQPASLVSLHLIRLALEPQATRHIRARPRL
jgi:hypothetical protein